MRAPPDLVFRYTITEDDIDADGITMAAEAIALNGGVLTDAYGNPAPLDLPVTDLSGAKVNGSAPGVTEITRLDPTPTNASDVQFQVTFNEPVTGVDVADFGLSMDGLTDAAVTGVSGSGSVYVVTASTDAGSGTLGLTALNGATITDADGHALGEGFSGGELYTLNRRPERVVDKFYTEGHGDIRIDYANGKWELHVHAEMLGEELAPDEVLTYGGPEGLTAAPQGPEWAFLGAEPGADIYVWPQSGLAGVPGPGLASEGIAAGTFAAYANTAPQVNATDEWLRFQAVAVRGPAGGHVSI